MDSYYKNLPYIEKEITLGIPSPTTFSAQNLLEEIVQNIRTLGNVKVIYPYTYNSNKEVDYVVDINLDSKYKGSGTNFLISFPGFIVFAPAWNGYKYYADINTTVTIKKQNETISHKSYPIKYDVNHSEFDRTWTQGADWLLTCGAASLIGGVVYTNFDNDIKDELTRTIKVPFSQYLARSIVGELTGR